MAKICQYDKMSLIMKKHFLMFTFIFSSLMLFAQPDFKPLAYFRLMGIVDLRREKGLDKPVVYKTLNLEFGMEVRILKVGEKDSKGQWLFVQTVEPMWINTDEYSDWLDKYERFWLYITPDMKILEYEE